MCRFAATAKLPSCPASIPVRSLKRPASPVANCKACQIEIVEIGIEGFETVILGDRSGKIGLSRILLNQSKSAKDVKVQAEPPSRESTLPLLPMRARGKCLRKCQIGGSEVRLKL